VLYKSFVLMFVQLSKL